MTSTNSRKFPPRRWFLASLIAPSVSVWAGDLLSLWLLKGVTEVSSDFLSGLITFDGILLAVVTLSLTIPFSGSKRWVRLYAAFLSMPFIVSALTAVYSLMRVSPDLGNPSLGPSVPVDIVVDVAIGGMVFGLVWWLMYAVVYPFLFEQD
jgi:hypothetical protein